MSRIKAIDLVKHFDGVTAVNKVSLHVEPGGKHAVVGPNGAGKSTLFDLITGEVAPSDGLVLFDGHDITSWPVHARANLGLGRTFQRNNLFLGLTAFENVRLAVQHKGRINRNWLKSIGAFSDVLHTTEAILEQVGLLDQKDKPAAELAYGQQRTLEIAMALATEPKILMLDEPTAGMSPGETAEITQLIGNLPPELTLLIVEHDMDVIFTLAETITVLHYGQVLFDGEVDEARVNPKVQEVYLGEVWRDARG